MARRLIWTKDAQLDRKEIFEFWNDYNKSKSYSRKLREFFKEGLEILKDFPHVGRKTKRKDIRLKLIRDYWLVYKITPKQIQILRIWDARRNPKEFKAILDQTNDN